MCRQLLHNSSVFSLSHASPSSPPPRGLLLSCSELEEMLACKMSLVLKLALVSLIAIVALSRRASAAATTPASTLPRDAMAISAFKEAIFDPQGMLAGWKGDPCSKSWNYISCSDASLNKTIIQLSLSNLQLGGEIPASLQNLKDLETLDLGNNNLHGPIPSWFGNLTKLVALDLQSNQLSGIVPKELGQLKNLVFLRVTNNSLSGHLPDEFEGLSSLKILACEDNVLSGSIPSTFSKLTTVSHLHMDHNKFTGTIPRWLGQFPDLIHLIINDNLLSGPLPPDLGTCLKLQQLKLDNNFITGPIPATLGLLTNLMDMRMRNNSLHGSIPTSFNNLISLHVLDLGFNSLEGSIPNDLGDLESLIFLNLQGNNLTGNIPSSFVEFSNIEIINLGDNKLTGVIPDLGLSTNLLSLEVEDNRLAGPIPPSLRKQGLDLLVYGNPLCSEAINNGTSACARHHGYTTSSVSPTCSCPFGMILNPLFVEGQSSMECDCLAPLLIELFFPRVLFLRCTKEKQGRLGQNLARELYLDTQQVIVKSAAQNGTGTDVMFLIVPMAGTSLDKSTLERIKKKLYAPYLSAVWFDGEFGWFDYAVVHFIPPFSQGGYNLTPSEIPGQSAMPFSTKRVSNAGSISIIAGCVTGGVSILLVILGMIFLIWRKHSTLRETSHSYRSSHNMASFHYVGDKMFLSSLSSSHSNQCEKLAKVFTMEELNSAANNFCSENLIGTGGFGAVYKGTLHNGTDVAIKKLSGLSKQGEEEFQNEIQMIVHRLCSSQLMQLLGYCSEQDERILVYELMANGSLLDYLKGGPREYPIFILDWKTRMQIALDSAKGLRYLHESNPPVVHRDIKPSNILLDENFHARVADFGLSKLFPTSGTSHVTTRVMGTFGYLAPDYSITGKLTVKSDVYSFGVVLLELLSGRNAMFFNDEGKTEFLIPWAKPLLKDKTKRSLVIDPDLQDISPTKGAELMASLILSCLELDPDCRPSMTMVENILAVISEIPVKAKSENTEKGAF